MMKKPEEIVSNRAKMIEYLEAALTLANEINDAPISYLIETALDGLRASTWTGNLVVKAGPLT